MMDWKLAWRTWRKYDSAQVLALRAIGAAWRSGSAALDGGASKGGDLDAVVRRAGASAVMSNQVGTLEAFGAGLRETPAAGCCEQLHLKLAGARFLDARDGRNNFIFRLTGAAS